MQYETQTNIFVFYNADKDSNILLGYLKTSKTRQK